MDASSSPQPPSRARRGGLQEFVRRLTSGPETLIVGPDRPAWSAGLVGLLALGLALRLPWLGAIPNPWGPEGTAALRALGLARSANPGGVGATVLTALTAGAFRVLGPSFTSARLVMVVALLAMVAASASLLRRRPALALTVVLLLHPWSVAWSRTGLDPAAVSLGLAALGPVAWWHAVRARSTWGVAAAAQLIALGLHFSPLALLPALACVAWIALPARRPIFTWPSTWVALAAGAFHAAIAVKFGPSFVGAPRPGLGATVRAIFDTVSGVSTLRYFAGAPSWVEALTAVAVLLLVAVSARRVLNDDLGRFAALQLLVAAVGLPLLGRHPVESWGFVLLAPWAIWCAAWAKTRPERAFIGGGSLAIAVTAALASHFLQGSGAELALRADAPDGRFWALQVPRERVAIASLVRAAVLADARGAPAVITWSEAAFEPLRFVIASAHGAQIVGASLDETIPEGRREYRLTNGRWVLMGWHRVHYWTMPGGLPLAAVWARNTGE